MNYHDQPHPIRRSPRAAHELQQVFERLQLENNRAGYNQDEEDEEDEGDEGDEEDEYSSSDDAFPPPIPRRRVDLYDRSPAASPREPPPRSPAHVNPLRSHPIAAAGNTSDQTPGPAPTPAQGSAPRHRFSHLFREQLHPPRLPDPAPRRHPTNLVSYKPVNQRLHPHLRRRTSLDTIASVTTTATARDVEVDESSELETPSPPTTPTSEYPFTRNREFGPSPTGEHSKSTSLLESLRTSSAGSTHSTPPTTPVSSAETHSPKGFLHKFKPARRKGSVGTDGGVDKLVIGRTVSVDQTSYRSNSSSPANTISSGTPSRPISETGNSRSSSTWTASSHDIGGLTPEEVQKCKKKGINPALFAEMKAARKGRWTSPIAGNTFLA